MNVEEAIKTAIEFETRVHRTYEQAAKKAADPTGRRVFEVLAKEEQGHLGYLKDRLEQWQKTGHLSGQRLGTAIPSKERIQEGVKSLSKQVRKKTGEGGVELDFLRKALEAEKETSNFYSRMASELPEEGRQLFARFVEIEQGHVAIVQAEIDAVSQSGHWFGMPEFSLEAE